MRTAVLVCFLASLNAFASTPSPSRHPAPVTVLLAYDQPYSQPSFAALQTHLGRLLEQVGLALDLRDRTSLRPHEQFSEVFVFQMKGSCSMDALPVGALSDERGALAMAYSSDGKILPFGQVECDRIRQSLQRIVGRANSHTYQSAFGTAVGMVMAHEIYHMLAHSAHHTHEGVTKGSLSARELLSGDLSLPEIARLAMRQSPSR